MAQFEAAEYYEGSLDYRPGLDGQGWLDPRTRYLEVHAVQKPEHIADYQGHGR